MVNQGVCKMITQQDIDTLTQRIDSLEATVKQLTGALVELSQKAGETAGRVDALKIIASANKKSLTL
mgnify:CR=1 FL=1